MQNARSKDERSKGTRGYTSSGSRPQPTEDSAGREGKGSRRHESQNTEVGRLTRKTGKRAPMSGPAIWRPRGETAQNPVEPPQLLDSPRVESPAILTTASNYQSEESFKQGELGEAIFQIISDFLPPTHQQYVGKITGMILENPLPVIYHQMATPLSRVRLINEALEVLHLSLRLDEGPYIPRPKPIYPSYTEYQQNPGQFADPEESESDDHSPSSEFSTFGACSSSSSQDIQTLLSSLPPPPAARQPLPQFQSLPESRIPSPPAVRPIFHTLPQPALMPPDDFEDPPPVQDITRQMDIATMPPEDIHIPVIRRRNYEPSIASTLSADSNAAYSEENRRDREEELDHAVENMVEHYPFMTFAERMNQAVIDIFERHLPLMVDDFVSHKMRYVCTILAFLILLIIAIFAAFANVNWCYALAIDLMLAIVIILQGTGRYIFPDSMVDDLYLFRQYYTLAALITLFALFIWSPSTFALINFLTSLLILKRFSFALFTSLHLYIIARWGFLVTPFFIVHLCLIQELIFVRKRSHPGVYKHPYLSLTNLTPRELEKRKVYDYMRKHPQVKRVKDFQDLEADPFYLSDATDEIMSDPRFRSYDIEEKKDKYKYPDGVTRPKTKYVYHDRDVRENKVVPFKDVRVRHPHFYQALLPLSTIRASNVLVCEELVNEAVMLALQKFGESPPADGLTSITRSLCTKIHYYNLPNCPVLVTNSIAHGYNRYLTINRARASTDEYLQTTSILLGLENAHYGRFRHRWYLRNFWLPEDHPFRLRLARFVSLHLCITLIPIYGYLWRHVPRILQEKTPTANATALMAMSGNNSVSADNVTQSVIDGHWVDNIVDFLSQAKRAVAGFSFLAYAQPLPAVNNYDNMVAGINGRLFVGEKKGVVIGQAKDYALRELRRTVEEDLDRWQPLADVLTKEEWLDLSKNYSVAKKNMLLKLEDTGRYLDTFFLKWESYTGFKAPRIISNSDKSFLTVEGPVIKSIEDQLESLPSTLTGIPVADWAKTVFNALTPYEDSDIYSIYVSDISSFESAITPKIKDATENLVFDRLLLNYPLLARKLRSRQQIRHYYKQMGEKVIEYDYNGRASGDARTYAGNTIVNHYLLRNLYNHFNINPLPYFVSGDDAIFVFPKHFPIQEIEHYYGQLGFSVEVNETTIAASGFCGFNFEEGTFRRVCADPISTILKFFMTQFPFKLGKYRAYLADQCLCLLHEYPGDPVLRPAVEWMLRNMTHRNENYRTWWQQQLMKDGNQWGQILRQPPMSFEKYAELHPEHTALFFENLSERFRDCVISISTHPDQYYAMKLESLIAQVDLGTPREIFNEFRILDPYAIEYDIDIGYYYPNLELVQAAALGLVETY